MNTYTNYKSLYTACETGDFNQVKILVGFFGTDVKTDDEYIKKSLLSCAYYGELDILKYLRKNGADIHFENDRLLDVASNMGRMEVVKWLVRKGCYTWDVIGMVLKYEDFDTVKFLMRKGCDCRGYYNKKYKILRKFKTFSRGMKVIKQKDFYGLLIMYFSPECTGGKLCKKEMLNTFLEI